jgi:ribonuclease-3
VYSLIEESGDDHDKTFRVGCTLGDQAITTEGRGSSRRAAEQAAAEAALQRIETSMNSGP